MKEKETWGYRLCRKKFDEQTRVALHEVYFRGEQPVNWTQNPVRIQTWVERDEPDLGDEKAQLAWLSEKIAQAFQREIIDLDALREAQKKSLVGKTRDEIREELGEPDDVGGTSRKQKEPLIWLYRPALEVHFNKDGRVSCIFEDPDKA